MTKRTKMKMTAFFHRLIYVVLGVEAVIIMVYMIMGMTSCSSDNDGDIPAVIHMENRSFEGSVNYVDDYLDTEVKYTISFSSNKDYILRYETSSKSKKTELQDNSLVESVGTYTISENNKIHLESAQITSSKDGLVFTRDVCIENNLIFEPKFGKLIKNDNVELYEIKYKTFQKLEGYPITMAPADTDLEIFVGKWQGSNQWLQSKLDLEVWSKSDAEGQKTYFGRITYTPSQFDANFTEPWVNEGEVSFNGCLSIGNALLECFVVTEESILFTTFYKAPYTCLGCFDPMVKVTESAE